MEGEEEWKRVEESEESEGEWRRVEEGEEEWRKVKESGGGYMIMEKVCIEEWV